MNESDIPGFFSATSGSLSSHSPISATGLMSSLWFFLLICRGTYCFLCSEYCFLSSPLEEPLLYLQYQVQMLSLLCSFPLCSKEAENSLLFYPWHFMGMILPLKRQTQGVVHISSLASTTSEVIIPSSHHLLLLIFIVPSSTLFHFILSISL